MVSIGRLSSGLLFVLAAAVLPACGPVGASLQEESGFEPGSICLNGECLEVPSACEGGEAFIRIKSVRPPLLEGPSKPLMSEDPEVDSDVEKDLCDQELTWAAEPPEPRWEPPKEETFECPADSIRINIRDLWSEQAEPTLGRMAERPLGVILIDEKWNEQGARQVSAGCDWYTACIPRTSLGTFQINALSASACSDTGTASGKIDFSAFAEAEEIWLHYPGESLSTDYTQFPEAGPGFVITDDRTQVESLLCAPGAPEVEIPENMVKLHVRYPWGDPALTGFAGTGCGDEALGFQVPPYPTTLKVQYEGCNNAVAMLEFQNGHCPWYSVLIPESQYTGKITIRYPDSNTKLFTPDIPLPVLDDGANESWLAYSGAPDDNESFGATCMNWSYRANVYHFFSANPGPGYAGCGGDGEVELDPCNPPVPDGFSTIHFRYMWAGQKTFSYFPKPEFMPEWIVLEVNGGGGDKDIICYREEDRPWFNCPVPNSEFFPGSEWRAADKTRAIDWNTVKAQPFPESPGEYWIRWNYGKPDIPETVRFETYDYYPDGSHGDWSATGDWGDASCAAKPPAEPVSVGYQGWFPYDETDYAYPFGASLAKTFADPETVQDLLDAFVQERYEMWKEQYLRFGAEEACAEDAARVHTEPPATVSEGQGYGIAIAAAMGDKETFVKLWNFVRHNLSQSSKKYCGGLMGWQWKGPEDCRPRDIPCDPDKEGCGGGNDSAFDGDVDIAIGLVYAARQWPEYVSAAVNWLLKMQCTIDTVHDGEWNYATPGDTWNKNCENYPDEPCEFLPGNDGRVNLSYYPPGYFRVFGEFLESHLDSRYWDTATRASHRAFWFRTAETVYEMYERCYENSAVNPALVTDWGSYESPCSSNDDNYNWARALWRVSVDAAWYGNRTDLPETQPGSSAHFAPASRMQAKIEAIQRYFSAFHEKNPPEESANRFSTLCGQLSPDGNVSGCDPALGHNSYFVNTALSAYVPVYDSGGETTSAIRREALEEAVTATVFNDRYYQESIGVYTMLFLSGNFPNPMKLK